VGLISLNPKPNSPLFIWNIYYAKVYIRVMEHEHELVDMQGLQFETFYKKPNHKREKIKSLQYSHRQISLCTKGSFHENGQCNYITILNYIFSLRLLCEYFLIRIMKVLFKCSSMATKCANFTRWRYYSFGL
jgi:hypothetical protein